MDNWSKIEFIYAHKLHISPLDLEQMEFYRIQYLLKEYEEYVNRENKEYDKQQRMIDKQSHGSNLKPPNLGGYNVPKFDMPKF